jgi:hypothetical protein
LQKNANFYDIFAKSPPPVLQIVAKPPIIFVQETTTSMHKLKNRRQQIAFRSFIYGVMTLAVMVGVILGVGWIMGYRFDWNSHQISQISLIQLGSFPSGANVDIDGKTQSFKTPGRQNVKTGQIAIKMSKPGYYDWTKSVNLHPSEVRWLTYARLVPMEIQTDSIKSFGAIKNVVASPDCRWLLIQTDEQARTLELADMSDPKNVRFSTLKINDAALSELLDGETERFSVVEWDGSSRYILLRREVGANVEYLRLDRRDAAGGRNLTREFGLRLVAPHFAGNGGDVFYGLTDQDLRRFDLAAKAMSAPLITGVSAYEIHAGNNRLAYVGVTTDQPARQVVGIYNDGENVVIKTYDEVQPTQARLSHFEDKDYLAVSRGETVAIIAEPLSQKTGARAEVYLSSPGGIDWLMFNELGRIVVAGHGDKLVSYDILTEENYSFQLPGLTRQPAWLDDFHLLDLASGRLAIVEFDGLNHTDIVSGRGPAVLSDDEKYLFSISDAGGGVVLQRSKLVID